MNNRFGFPDHLFRVKQADDTWSITPATYASRFIQEMEKRYGMIYVDKDNTGKGTLNRLKKDSFAWYQQVIASNGETL